MNPDIYARGSVISHLECKELPTDLTMLQLLYLAYALLQVCFAAPIEQTLGVKLGERGDLPTVTFADATYQASNHDEINDVRLFDFGR